MPDYDVIPDWFKDDFSRKFESLDLSKVDVLARDDPVIFGKFFFGKTVRLHQAWIMHLFVDAMKKGKIRLAFCLARQLGKTVSGAIILVWTCWYNKLPATMANITIWYCVSRDDETAVEFLEKIRLLLWDADRHMSKYTGTTDFFSGSLKEPNNTHQLTFLNNCFIKSIPPTKKALGKSGNLWIDEAHRLNCTDIDSDTFFDYAIAMTSETNGAIVLSSSPEGIVGFFYRAIDPNKEFVGVNEYDSVWFSHTVWDDGSEECKRYQAFVESERVRLTAAGRFKYWQQEYEASFTVTETSFFEHSDVDNAVKDTPQRYEWFETPCALGIDYGLKTSRHAFTIRTKINDELIQLFQFRAPADFDINNFLDPSFEHSIHKLKQRYNLFMIIPDDSAPGDSVNRWLEANANVPVKKYNFRSDQMSKTDGINRNCLAYSYRAALKAGWLKIPKWNTTQIFEMKTVQEVEQKVLISIKAPTGHLCDTFDSDMMACLPFLDMQDVKDFHVDTTKEPVNEEVIGGGRVDKQCFRPLTLEECKALAEEVRISNEPY